MTNKITLELTRRELIDLANMFRDAQFNDVEFLKIKNKEIREIFEKSYKERHKLWLKIIRLLEK